MSGVLYSASNYCPSCVQEKLYCLEFPHCSSPTEETLAFDVMCMHVFVGNLDCPLVHLMLPGEDFCMSMEFVSKLMS